jgi:hypothetical protein
MLWMTVSFFMYENNDKNMEKKGSFPHSPVCLYLYALEISVKQFLKKLVNVNLQV